MQVLDGAVDIEEGNLRFDHLHSEKKTYLCLKNLDCV